MTFEESIKAMQKPSDQYKWPQQTIGHLIGAIFAVNTKEDAKEFYDGYVEWLSKQSDLKDAPESVAKSNIGWAFGEGMSEEKRALWRYVGASHPIFGSMHEDPTPQQAFNAGISIAKG